MVSGASHKLCLCGWPTFYNPRVMIRRATLDDAPAVLECLQAAFAPFRPLYSADAFADTTLTPDTVVQRFATMQVFALELPGAGIVGTIACAVEDGATGHMGARGARAGLARSGHIRGMAVLPDFQGKGVADQLLRAAEDALRAAGCARVTLDTTAPLQRAIRFYARNGYRATGQVGDFYGMELFQYAKEF